MFVEINNTKIWCDLEGNGIPLILPSYSGVPYLQRALPATLRKFFKMIFIEPRGGGRSEKGDELSLDIIADDIEEIRKVFNIKKAFFFGWAANSYIAIDYAVKYSQSVLGLIFIGLPPIYDEQLLEAQKKYWDSDASESRKKTWEEKQDELRKQASGDNGINERIINEYVANGPKYFFDPKFDSSSLWRGQIFNYKNMQEFYGTLLMGYNALEKLEQINVPMILFNGKYDFNVPYTFCGKELDKLNCEKKLFDKSGHYLFMEQENEFIKFLMPWIYNNNK